MKTRIKNISFAIILLLTLFFVGCSSDEEGGLEGQLMFQNQPLAAAEVEVYLKAEKDRSVQPFAVATTDAKGHYQLSLPKGRYFVIGKKREATADGRTRMLMADSPANPLQVAGGMTQVPSFNLREMGREGLQGGDAETGVSGRITWQGEPADRAFLYVYTETETGLVGPSYGEAVQAGEDGRFSVNLPAGSYFLVARKRAGGSRSGALAPGDLNAHYSGNPVVVERGQRRELGDLALARVDEETFSRRQREGLFTKTDTMLTGRVETSEGEAVSGVYVFAFLDSRMIGKPVHMSSATDNDGSFELYLSDAGTYYIGARSAFGGPLEPGEWIGTYDARADHSVQVAHGAKDDLGVITVREFW